MLLPVEIENVKFSRSVGGYTPAEVDEFLDYIKSKCGENADAEARLAVSVNEAEVLKGRIAELEAQVDAVTAERDELTVKNDELKAALAEAIAQAASKAAEALSVNNVAADPVWDPDADEEIPEPFRVGDDGETEDEPSGEIEGAEEAEDTESSAYAPDILTEADGENDEDVSEKEELTGPADEDTEDVELENIDLRKSANEPSTDEEIAAALEAALANLDVNASSELSELPDDVTAEDAKGYGGIDVSLDFDEIEGADGEEENDNDDIFADGVGDGYDEDGSEDGEATDDIASAIGDLGESDGSAAEEAVAVDENDEYGDGVLSYDTDMIGNIGEDYEPANEEKPAGGYARRVYHIRLKRSKHQSDDQALLDALRAAYDDGDDDLTQHEYDQYHYTFDSGRK